MTNLINALPLFVTLCGRYEWSTRMDHVNVFNGKVKGLRILVSERKDTNKYCTIHVDSNGFGYWQSSQAGHEDDEYFETAEEVLDKVLSFLR